MENGRTRIASTLHGPRTRNCTSSDVVLPLNFHQHFDWQHCGRVRRQGKVIMKPRCTSTQSSLSGARAVRTGSSDCRGALIIHKKLNMRNRQVVLQKEVSKEVLLASPTFDMEV